MHCCRLLNPLAAILISVTAVLLFAEIAPQVGHLAAAGWPLACLPVSQSPACTGQHGRAGQGRAAHGMMAGQGKVKSRLGREGKGKARPAVGSSSAAVCRD